MPPLKERPKDQVSFGGAGQSLGGGGGRHAAQARAANPSANQGQQYTGAGIDNIDLIVPVVTAIVIGIYMGATGGDRPGWMTATPY